METKYTKEEVLKVITSLIGDVNPIGETNFDNARFQNLQVLCGVVEELIVVIDNVSWKNKDAHEYSVKRAAEFADNFLSKKLGITND